MEIVKVPNKILKKRLQPVGLDNLKQYFSLAEEMRQAMIKAQGVGLAANQLGQDLSIFVIDKKLADENKVPDAFINPEITEYSKESDELEEGCLSMPGFYVPIKRSKKIKIKAIDQNGNKLRLKAKGFLARVLQHEVDHLNGLLIKDRSNGKS